MSILAGTITANLHYFTSINNGSVSFFLSSGMHQPHHFVDAMLQVLVAYIFLKRFMLFKSITPCHTSGRSNSFRIIFIKINIIKVHFIKIYTNKTYFISKKCDIIRIFINKDYIIIRE